MPPPPLGFSATLLFFSNLTDPEIEGLLDEERTLSMARPFTNRLEIWIDGILSWSRQQAWLGLLPFNPLHENEWNEKKKTRTGPRVLK